MNRKLRKMKKIELLELLLEQEKEIEKLRSENETLRKENDIQRLKIENAGSIAEAALQLSGIFEAAQKAADLYLKSVQPCLEEEESVEEEQEGDKAAEDPQGGSESDGEGTETVHSGD